MGTSSNEIFQVAIRSLTPNSLNSKLKDKITQSVFDFENAVKSNYFKNEVLNFNNSKNGFNKRFNLRLDNKGVYLKIINAVEKKGNIKIYVADLYLNVIRGKPKDGRTIGFVHENSKVIHTYSDFISSLSKESLSAHFAHEWAHLLGFGHPIDTGTNAAYLRRTIPYAIGKIVKEYLETRFSDLRMGENSVAQQRTELKNK